MNDKLQILITAGLNQGLSIGEINKGLKQLAKHPSLQKLKVGIQIDKKTLQQLNDFNNNLSKITKASEQQKVSTEESAKALNKETEAMKRATQAQKEWNEEQKKTFRDAHGKVTGTTTTYGSGNTKQIVAREPDGSVRSIVDIENQKKDLADYNKMLDQAYKENEAFNKRAEALDRAHYMALRDNKAKIEAMDKMHYMALKQNRDFDLKIKNAQLKETEMLDRAHYMALKTDRQRKEALDRAHYMALREDRQRQVNLEKQFNQQMTQARHQVLRLNNNPLRDKRAIAVINAELMRMNSITPQNIARIRELRTELTRLGIEAQGAGVKTSTFMGAFQNAMIGKLVV